MMMRWAWVVAAGVLAAGAMAAAGAGARDEAEPLFPGDRLDGWRVGNWNGVERPPGRTEPSWTISEGVLKSEGSGTWLVSPGEYGDFVLTLEAKLEPRANGGIGLRFPPEGDPAFRGIEVQVVDPDRERDQGLGPLHVTGAVYDELASEATPRPPGEWNAFEITLKGPHLKVSLNGRTAVEADLSRETEKRSRGVPLAERPRRGHIGFQNINGTVMYRDLKIRRLD